MDNELLAEAVDLLRAFIALDHIANAKVRQIAAADLVGDTWLFFEKLGPIELA